MGVLRTRVAPVGRPFKKGNPGGGRRKGVPNKATQENKELTRHFLQSEEYRQSIKRRILAGKAPQLEILFHHYAFGKPTIGLEPSGAAGGPVPPARVLFLPRNGREVEVDGDGRVGFASPTSPTRTTGSRGTACRFPPSASTSWSS